jgi:hypothetical protein
MSYIGSDMDRVYSIPSVRSGNLYRSSVQGKLEKAAYPLFNLR